MQKNQFFLKLITVNTWTETPARGIINTNWLDTRCPFEARRLLVSAYIFAHQFDVSRSILLSRNYSVFKHDCLSNLRPTSRECVHLVTRGHFRSRDRRGGHHSIRHSRTPMLNANFTALCVTEAELLPIEVLHCGNRNFRRLFAPVTLTLTRWPSFSLRTWHVFPRNILDERQRTCYTSRLSKVIVGQTVTTTTLLRGWSTTKLCNYCHIMSCTSHGSICEVWLRKPHYWYTSFTSKHNVQVTVLRQGNRRYLSPASVSAITTSF